MSNFESLGIIDFDHLEFAVADIQRATELYLHLGFERQGTREVLQRQLKSVLLVQNNISIVLSQSSLKTDPVARFVEAHGDGVYDIVFRCEDAVSALEATVNRGAEVAEAPRSCKKDFGSVAQASIKACGDVRHSFLSRQGTLFAEGFDVATRPATKGYGLQRIDHVTINVDQGQLDTWTAFYENVFGLKNTRFFDIHTERTGLYSKVMQSPGGAIKLPFNEPMESASQIQEFININHGPGVQHVALATDAILPAVRELKREGIAFLDTPSTYYEALAARLPQMTESTEELQSLGILADGNESGYLLQIFTQNVVGPFFYEIIQRKGDDGFGEGNFRALFEAMERDQIRRGVLELP